MKATIPLLCQAHGLPQPEAELRFAPPRRWRFDWAWPSVCLTSRVRKCSGANCRMSKPVALEIEGGVFTAGRHTRGLGVLKDMEKYNTAALMGWTVLRCTPKDVASGAVAELLKRALL